MTAIPFEQMQERVSKQCRNIFIFWGFVFCFSAVMTLLGFGGGNGYLVMLVDAFVVIGVFLCYGFASLPLIFSKSINERNLGFKILGALFTLPAVGLILVAALQTFSPHAP